MTERGAHPFLLGLLRGTNPAALLHLIRAEQEWEAILQDAAAQGFAPLLYRRLGGSAAGKWLPLGLADRLERQAMSVAARNLILADELASILRALEARGIPCVPLRGLALAERLYGDITARPMGDLDLLVRKEDLPAVTRLLWSQGLTEMDRRRGFAAAFSYTLKFVKERHGWIIVEPHWTIAYPPFVDRVDMPGVWARCARARVLGVETWLLGPEELALHLCLHVTHREGTAPLLWHYEIDRLIRQSPAFDWSRFLSLAQQGRLERLLSDVVRTVTRLFATPVPEPVRDRLERKPAGRFEGRLQRLLAGESAVDGKESLAVFLTLKGFGAKLGYASALLFPSRDFMVAQYGLTGGRGLGLAYARRVCRFAWEGLKGVLRLSGMGETQPARR